MSFTQFRLTSGEEIVAEVIDEPEGDDYNIVLRKAMVIIRAESHDGTRFYSFRPWMTYQSNPDYLQLLNFNHIVGEAKPDPLLLEQYHKAYAQEREGDDEPTDVEKVRALVKLVKGGYVGPDSDGDNIISLFDRNKLN